MSSTLLTHRHIKDSSSPITKYLSNRFSLSFLLSSYHLQAFGPSPFFPAIPPASFSSSFTRLRSFRVADIIGSQEKAGDRTLPLAFLRVEEGHPR